MKTSHVLKGGQLIGLDGSDTRYLHAWAAAYIKFLDLWAAKNVRLATATYPPPFDSACP
jgi:hypothetical protein